MWMAPGRSSGAAREGFGAVAPAPGSAASDGLRSKPVEPRTRPVGWRLDLRPETAPGCRSRCPVLPFPTLLSGAPGHLVLLGAGPPGCGCACARPHHLVRYPGPGPPAAGPIRPANRPQGRKILISARWNAIPCCCTDENAIQRAVFRILSTNRRQNLLRTPHHELIGAQVLLGGLNRRHRCRLAPSPSPAPAQVDGAQQHQPRRRARQVLSSTCLRAALRRLPRVVTGIRGAGRPGILVRHAGMRSTVVEPFKTQTSSAILRILPTNRPEEGSFDRRRTTHWFSLTSSSRA